MATTIIAQQQAAQQTKNQQAENKPRFATYGTTYDSTGNGYFVDKSPIMFGCSFLEEPFISHGISIVKAPDPAHYQYPVANAGVYKWVLQQNPADAGKSDSDPTNLPFYVGAYVYFSVKIDSLIYPRTDGSNLAALQTQLASASPSSTLYTTLKANIAEAQEAIYLAAHAPQCMLTHSISFSQVASKNLTDTVTQQLNSDPTLTPNVAATPFNGTAASS